VGDPILRLLCLFSDNRSIYALDRLSIHEERVKVGHQKRVIWNDLFDMVKELKCSSWGKDIGLDSLSAEPQHDEVPKTFDNTLVLDAFLSLHLVQRGKRVVQFHKFPTNWVLDLHLRLLELVGALEVAFDHFLQMEARVVTHLFQILINKESVMRQVVKNFKSEDKRMLMFWLLLIEIQERAVENLYLTLAVKLWMLKGKMSIHLKSQLLTYFDAIVFNRRIKFSIIVFQEF